MEVFCIPKPQVGGFGCDELVLYGIRDTGGATLSTNESGPHCKQTVYIHTYISSGSTLFKTVQCITVYWEDEEQNIINEA